MKKAITKFLSLAICSVLVLSVPVNIQAKSSDLTSTEKATLKTKLDPYQDAIDEINKEYGSSVKINDQDLNEVYNNAKNMTVDEFKKQTKQALLDAKKVDTNVVLNIKQDQGTFTQNKYGDTVVPSGEEKVALPSEDKVSVDSVTSNPVIKLKDKVKIATTIINENIEQTYSWSQGKVYMISDITGTSGSLSSYYFSSIKSVGYYKLTTNHFRASSYTSSLMDSNKTCKVVYTGGLYSSAGVYLATPMTVTAYYFAAGSTSTGTIASIGNIITLN